MHLKLSKRKKRSRLTPEEQLYLINILKNHSEYEEHLISVYKLSPWLVRKLKKIIDPDHLVDGGTRSSQQSLALEPEVEDAIKGFVKPPQRPTTLGKICQHVYKETNVEVTQHQIRKFLKTTMRYSFKKGFSRPPKYLSIYSSTATTLFCTSLLKQIMANKIIVNVDEWGFSRSTRQEYSWLPINQASPLIKDWNIGRCDLILGVLNNGHWIGMIKNGSTNSNDYWLFLLILVKSLTAAGIDVGKDMILLHDNASTHLSGKVKQLTKKKNLVVYGLPQYQPVFAAWELVFGIIKKRMKFNSNFSDLNFNKESGKRAIIDAARSVSENTVRNWWAKVVRMCKQTLEEKEDYEMEEEQKEFRIE